MSEKEGQDKFVCKCVYGCVKFVSQQGCMSAYVCANMNRYVPRPYSKLFKATFGHGTRLNMNACVC